MTTWTNRSMGFQEELHKQYKKESFAFWWGILLFSGNTTLVFWVRTCTNKTHVKLLQLLVQLQCKLFDCLVCEASQINTHGTSSTVTELVVHIYYIFNVRAILYKYKKCTRDILWINSITWKYEAPISCNKFNVIRITLHQHSSANVRV